VAALLRAPQSRWFAQPIASMSTIAREWAALHRTDRIPLLRTLLSGKVGLDLLAIDSGAVLSISCFHTSPQKLYSPPAHPPQRPGGPAVAVRCVLPLLFHYQKGHSAAADSAVPPCKHASIADEMLPRLVVLGH
jgi:hypothetical protein